MTKKEDIYKAALKGKRIPILTLDNKWHRLFTMMEPDRELKRLEEQLNTLLKRQGKWNTESKSIHKIKKKLMEEIVQLMENEDPASLKKIDENKRLIEECNEKLEEYKSNLLEIPSQIEEANYELMLRTMELCYDILQENTKDIDEIGAWITNVRIELKKNIVRKQEKEAKNNQLYSYMHDIFGADVVEIFDVKEELSEKYKEKHKKGRKS